MEELKKILSDHAKCYPLMEPTDAVKLIYQNEFGGGHMIRDEQACMDYLRKEYESIAYDPECPRYESIGNGIVRVHLAAVKPGELNQLGAEFIRSANTHVGSMERFLEKLEVLRQLAAKGTFNFCAEDMEKYLQLYKQAGYTPVSHSRTYRQHYRPAYRVIRNEE